MVSRRNFIVITLIIFVILFLFQLFGAVKDSLNKYDKNEYLEETKSSLTAHSAYELKGAYDKKDRDYVVYIGSEDSSLASVVEQWCTFTKRALLPLSHLEYERIDLDNPPATVLLDSSYMDWSKDIVILERLIKEGINFVFCNIPPFEVIENSKELQRILGVIIVAEPEINLEGVKLFGGFLLGGEEVYQVKDSRDAKYQDMDLSIPWYCVGSGTKTYMVGLLDEEEFDNLDNEFLPAIIWRNSIGNSRIFAVNGDYLNTNTGLGILNAMMAEQYEYEIYPVVNAQTLITLDYPIMAVENNSEMYERYSRSSDSLYMNIIWPSMISLTTKIKARLTCMMNLQLDYEDGSEPDEEKLQYYFKLIREQKGEVGLSGSQVSQISLADKLTKDYAFIESSLPDYGFTSFYAGTLNIEDIIREQDLPILNNIKTLLVDYDHWAPMVSYTTEDILLLKATIDGFSHTSLEDLRVKSMMTSLGYSAIVVDMKRILYPNKDTAGWEYLQKELSRFTTTYWRKFTDFEQVTLSECDKRMRNFLAMDYQDNKNENIITLQISNFNEEGWFILRTHGEEISSLEGGTYEEIERNAYLLRAKEDKIQIHLKDTKRKFFMS